MKKDSLTAALVFLTTLAIFTGIASAIKIGETRSFCHSIDSPFGR